MAQCGGNPCICNIKGHFHYNFKYFFKIKREAMTNKIIFEHDLNVLWNPCTQMKDHAFLSMISIKSAKGVWLEGFDVMFERLMQRLRDCDGDL